MSDSALTSHSPAAESPAPAAPVRPPLPPAPRTAGLLVWLGLLVAVLALVLGALLWQRLGLIQQELARRQQDSAAQAAQAMASAAQSDALAQELQARLAVAEVKLSEVVLQRSQLDELMLSLSRSRDDTLVQDLESALRLALQQSQLTGSVQPLLSALQAADQRIARAAQPRLNPVQRAMARDIERIQAAQLADVPALVQRLGELTRQVDQWPLLNDVGPRAAGGDRLPAPAPATGAPEGAAVWQRAWADLVQGLRDLVRVGRIDQPEAALLAPEQAFFLRENLKLQLLNARLGLLARQPASAQADLRAVEALLVRYFDGEAPNVKGALAATSQLRAELDATDLPRPDESLAALAAAAGGR